jgi:hypothetical protein
MVDPKAVIGELVLTQVSLQEQLGIARGRIEALEAENKKLREAVTPPADPVDLRPGA